MIKPRLLAEVSLFVLISVLFSPQFGLADVAFLPRNKEELDLLRNSEVLSQEDQMVHVEGASVAYFSRSAIERDFPFLTGKSDSEIEGWILKNCAYVSEAQLKLDEIRQSSIPVSAQDKKQGYRPTSWNRAAVIPVFNLEGKQDGLIDVKGVGLPAGSVLLQQQVDVYKKSYASQNQELIDQLRTKDHSDGLSTLGEAIAEVVRAEALQKIFDHHNAIHRSEYQTVEHYFVIAMPFSILKDGTRKDPAALVGRQAHLGRSNLGIVIPNELYVDFSGGKQSDLLGSVVDMGGVFLTSPEYHERFLTPKQIEALSDKSLLHNSKLVEKIFDPQLSKEWKYAHEIADVYAKDKDAGKKAIYFHLQEMVGDQDPAHHPRPRQRLPLFEILKSRLTDSSPLIRKDTASALSQYSGEHALSLFEFAFECGDQMVRHAVAKSFPQFHGPERPLLFEKALSANDVKIRSSAASALPTYKGSKYDELFEKAIGDNHPKVRSSTVSSLPLYNGNKALQLYQKAISDSDPTVRKAAASVLTSYSGVESFQLIEKALMDENPTVRRSAAFALKDYSKNDALLLFEKALTDKDPSVRKFAAEAVAMFRGPDADLIFEKAFFSEDPEVRKRATSRLDYH